MFIRNKKLMLLTTATLMASSPALAQEVTLEGVQAETAFVFNTVLFLMGGFLVMFMAAGFAMLEAGLVRSKNVSMQCLKNIALYSIAGIMFWVCGYSLMYSGVGDNGGWFGSFAPYSWPAAGEANDGDYSVASDWFFQMVFCAATASIVSGTVAERIKLRPFLIFVAVLTGVLYPISGSWQWGGGWLSRHGFKRGCVRRVSHLRKHKPCRSRRCDCCNHPDADRLQEDRCHNGSERSACWSCIHYRRTSCAKCICIHTDRWCWWSDRSVRCSYA